jgi:hypothetical protein
MLVFSDAAKRWQHIMWLDAGQELRASIDGVRSVLMSTGHTRTHHTFLNPKPLIIQQGTSSLFKGAT